MEGKEFQKHYMQQISHEKVKTQGVALSKARKINKEKSDNAHRPEQLPKCAYRLE